MKVLVAPDRFEPTVKPLAAAQAMARGLTHAIPTAVPILRPLTSGGQGTTDLAVRAGGGRIRHWDFSVPGHRSRPVKWAELPDGSIIFDAKDALGDPNHGAEPLFYSDSFPVGWMLQKALSLNPKRVLVSLGDVVVADGGLGLLRAFGVNVFGPDGKPVQGLRQLVTWQTYDFSQLNPSSIPILGLVDTKSSFQENVQNGTFRLDLLHNGLNQALDRLAQTFNQHVALPVSQIPGSAAGGGLGLALAFLGASFLSAGDYLADLWALPELLLDVDWVFTGCTTLGASVRDGAVGTVSRLARDYGVPAIALAAVLDKGHADLYDEGLSGIYPLLDRPRPTPSVWRSLATLIEHAAYRVGLWMQALSED